MFITLTNQIINFNFVFRFGTDQITIEVVVADVPSQPLAVQTSNVATTSAVLSWTEPTDNGGEKIFKYKIEKSLADSDQWMKVTITNHVQTLVSVIINLLI